MTLIEIRKEIGKSQASVAKALGWTRHRLAKFERDVKIDELYISDLRRYLEALGGELQIKITFPNGRP